MKRESQTQQIGVYFDQTRCMGCDACVISCKQWHKLPPGPASWIRMKSIEEGLFPNPYLAFLPSRCFHCENPSCMPACPAGAIRKREEDGIVVVDREKCLGRDACGQACSNACPAGTDTRGFVACIKNGDYEDAWRVIVETNPFPGVCGRVCDHPCESACMRGQVDEPVAIHALERLASDHMPPVEFYAPYDSEKRSQKVAVIGSGPAGLTCAYHLARRGYNLTVFEALPLAGGMLRVGIPEYHLPKEVLEREIAFITSCGVKIKTNMRLGDNLKPSALDMFDAVFIATGAYQANIPNIAGLENARAGVMTALDFLQKVALNEPVNLGKHVLVIGGGDVALDCFRSARRLGVSDIRLACLESLEQMPATADRLAQAMEEGLEIYPSRSFRRILEEDGCCTGLECMKLRGMEFREDGSLRLDLLEDSEHTIPADTIILAAGQRVDTGIFPEGLKIKGGRIAIDENGATSLPKYFAGGDAAIPQAKVSYAIGSGRRAADAIHRQLQGLPDRAATSPAEIRKSELQNTDIFVKRERVGISTLHVDDRLSSFAEVELGLRKEEGRNEAGRCLECRGMCSIACPYDAPQFGVEMNPKMQKCDSCLEDWIAGKQPMCVRSCPARALDIGTMDDLRAKYGGIREAENFIYSEKNGPSIIFKPKYNK